MCDNCGCGSHSQTMNSPEMFNTDSQDTLGTAQDLPLTSAPSVGLN